MKKTFIFASTLLLLTPSIAFAAWWNPFSWFAPKVAPQIVATSSVATTSVTVIATTTPKIVQKKIIPVVSNPPAVQPSVVTQTPVVQTPTITPPPNTNLCNGTYYTVCSSGQNFVCPTIGKAYCQMLVAPTLISVPSTEQTQSINDQQNNSQIRNLESQYGSQVSDLTKNCRGYWTSSCEQDVSNLQSIISQEETAGISSADAQNQISSLQSLYDTLQNTYSSLVKGATSGMMVAENQQNLASGMQQIADLESMLGSTYVPTPPVSPTVSHCEIEGSDYGGYISGNSDCYQN